MISPIRRSTATLRWAFCLTKTTMTNCNAGWRWRRLWVVCVWLQRRPLYTWRLVGNSQRDEIQHKVRHIMCVCACIMCLCKMVVRFEIGHWMYLMSLRIRHRQPPSLGSPLNGFLMNSLFTPLKRSRPLLLLDFQTISFHFHPVFENDRDLRKCQTKHYYLQGQGSGYLVQ